MTTRSLISAATLALLLGCATAAAQQVDITTGSIAEKVAKLRAGEFVWAPQIAPKGPLMLIVNVRTQRAVLFRNGVPIGATTVSTGKQGRETPTGVFTILEKHVEHYSSKYDSAPMPYMQRLTWQGVALHAGHLPGYPASHGCIRMPAAFAKLLYGTTTVGMTVVITANPTGPRIAPTPQLTSEPAKAPAGDIEWRPELSPTGPVSIVVSVADSRAEVLRNGIKIGSAPVTVEGPVSGTWAYALRNVDGQGQHWIRVGLSDDHGGQPVPSTEWQRFKSPEEFRVVVSAIVEPGTTVVVTPDSLRSGAVAAPATVIEASPKAN